MSDFIERHMKKIKSSYNKLGLKMKKEENIKPTVESLSIETPFPRSEIISFMEKTGLEIEETKEVIKLLQQLGLGLDLELSDLAIIIKNLKQ